MSGKAYFSPGSFEFLDQLREHNVREWFQANKTRYEELVRDPFLALIADLAPDLSQVNSGFVADPRPVGGSMMRIYRDTRFSKDKSPYKTSVTAHFWHSKGKGEAAPALFVHFEPGGSFAGGGTWMPEPAALKIIRDRIVSHPDQWRAATSGKVLGTKCAFAGESLKKAPAGYDPNHPLIEDIKRKSFAIGGELTDAEVCGTELKARLLERFRSTAPLAQFLSEALGLD